MSPRLLALCFGNFMIGTGTLIVPGMLPALADGLGVSLPAAGQLITVFALTICLSAPLLAGATSRIERRALLVGLMLLYVLSHAAAALATSHAQLLAIRAISSISAGLYVSQAAATAALLVPESERGRAMAFVFLGWAVATVAGLPLGAYVGATAGWRAGFALVAAGSLVSAFALQAVLPAGLRVKPIDAAMWRSLFRHPAILPVAGVTVFCASAQFALFAYFVPAAQALVGASASQVSLLLACFGVFAVAGNALSGGLADRYGAARVVLASLGIMLAGVLIWPWSRDAIGVLAASLVVLGSGSFAFNAAQQVRLVGLSPAHAPVSVAFNSSAIYLGQGIGTAAAGALLAYRPGTDGYLALAFVSVPLLAVAIAGSLLASRRGLSAAPA